MILVENISVYNIENAIRGMRNPLESWEQMNTCGDRIGQKDLELAQKLVLAGTDHSKFMRQIFVSMDITAPLYWWKEMDTYKVGTTANSTSTMHKLATTPITKECFSFDKDLDHLAYYFDTSGDGQPFYWVLEDFLEELIFTCERLRQRYLKTKLPAYWRALVQLLPESWNQKRTWTANYQVLRNIYFARKSHKLKEWEEFCQIIKTLPYGKKLICYEKGEK